VLLSLTIVVVAALVGGGLAKRLGQPAVLGELVAGIGVGAVPALHHLRDEPALETLSELGVLVLLFAVGLESTVGKMLQVGKASLRVAVLGVVAPFALGWGVGRVLLPQASIYAHVFLGATLCATSVGITARVLKDLRRADDPESRVILGAAVIDDVLGLLVLAVVTGVIASANAGTAFELSSVLWVTAKAVGFLLVAVGVGLRISRRLAEHPVAALGFCLLLSWAAGAAGLSPIVGAFAAGLVIQSEALEAHVAPIARFLVPFFFVRMGMMTELSAFARPDALFLALVLTAAAVLGKQACSLGAGGGLDRATVGIGMIPRGEVGLIFAGAGLTLTVHGARLVDESIYAALVVMVMATTLMTPPLLKWSLARGKKLPP
jgi:Kef-type K+ transport system membrane component KefB